LTPNYGITVNPPPELVADRFETNQDKLHATNLGDVHGTQNWDNLSVDTAQDEDWFKFNTASTATAGQSVSIAFRNGEGDLDLRLYGASKTPLAVSAGAGDGEQISLAGLPAGTYYVQVIGFNGAVQPSYALSITAPAGPSLQPDRLDQASPNNSRT